MTTSPSVQRIGSALLLQGPVLTELRQVLRAGMPVLARRDAYSRPSLILLETQVNRAIAVTGKDPAPVVAIPGGLNQRDWIGSVEAASVLGLQPRQIRNLRDRLGGRKVGNSWTFDLAAVQAEAQRRKETQ